MRTCRDGRAPRTSSRRPIWIGLAARKAIRAKREELTIKLPLDKLAARGEWFFALRDHVLVAARAELSAAAFKPVIAAKDKSEQILIDWFRPSPDGRLVAVALNDKDREGGSLQVYDAASGKKVGGVIPRVQLRSKAVTQPGPMTAADFGTPAIRARSVRRPSDPFISRCISTGWGATGKPIGWCSAARMGCRTSRS